MTIIIMQAELITSSNSATKLVLHMAHHTRLYRPRSDLLTTTIIVLADSRLPASSTPDSPSSTPDSPSRSYHALFTPPHANKTRRSKDSQSRIHVDNHPHPHSPPTPFRLNNPRTTSALLLTQSNPPTSPRRFQRPRISAHRTTPPDPTPPVRPRKDERRLWGCCF